MEPRLIESRIQAALPEAQVILGGDGCNCEATVISDDFAGQTRLARQRTVMNAVADLIHSGALHALSIKTFTHDEWNTKN
jgi:acid stress-induced BolA-like protein IbaG/YrbA